MRGCCVRVSLFQRCHPKLLGQLQTPLLSAVPSSSPLLDAPGLKQWEKLVPAPQKEGAPCQLSSFGCPAPHRDLRLWLEPSVFPHLMLSFVFLRQGEPCVQIIKGKNWSD